MICEGFRSARLLQLTETDLDIRILLSFYEEISKYDKCFWYKSSKSIDYKCTKIYLTKSKTNRR